MTDSPPFAEWLDRVRAHDPAAAAELVAAVTPLLRRVVRDRLVRFRLGRVVDPQDVCQAAFGRFFARVSAVWPPVETATDLRALLAAIARNRARDEARRYTAGRRDHRRDVRPAAAGRLTEVASREPSPGHALADRELFDRAVTRLSADEQGLLEDRLAGRPWAAIAADRGVSAVAVRQQFNRAVRRVRRSFEFRV